MPDSLITDEQLDHHRKSIRELANNKNQSFVPVKGASEIADALDELYEKRKEEAGNV